MNDKFVVIFNGPPGSGKDTIVDGLKEHCENFSGGLKVVKLAFKDALYEETYKYLVDIEGFSPEAAKDIVEKSKVEDVKDTPLENGVTPREYLIKVSEEYIKPKFGKDFFGKKFLEKVQAVEGEAVILCPDGGFKEELFPLSIAGIPTVVIRLFRDGKSFEGDSRGYINGHLTYGIENNGTVEQAVGGAASIIAHSTTILEDLFSQCPTTYH